MTGAVAEGEILEAVEAVVQGVGYEFAVCAGADGGHVFVGAASALGEGCAEAASCAGGHVSAGVDVAVELVEAVFAVGGWGVGHGGQC